MSCLPHHLQLLAEHTALASVPVPLSDSAGGLQLSVVCSKFAAAAAQIPALRQGLALTLRDAVPGRLDSRLLVQWAGRMECLHLYDHLYGVPDLQQLLSAFRQPLRLHLSCSSPLTAAQCDYLLSKCGCVEALILHGPYLPSILPLTVKTLRVRFSMLAGAVDPVDAIGQADAFLYRAERLPALEQLRLDLSCISVIRLICPVQLHKLKALFIKLRLEADLRLPGEGLLDLAWAMLQPCCSLEVHVELRTRNLGMHAALVQQLSRAHVGTLTLVPVSIDYFSGPIQRLWSRLQVPKLAIVVLPRGVGGLSAASGQPDTSVEPLFHTGGASAQ